MANLRYRNARNDADLLGQVFTPQSVARLLASDISSDGLTIQSVLDLGAGEGALAAAILEQHKTAKATLVEIDRRYVEALKKQMPRTVKVIHADVLGDKWDCEERPDVIVSNPPYGTIFLAQEAKDLLSKSTLQIPSNSSWGRSDIAFLARAWSFSQKGSKLGFIVPSPIIRGDKYKKLRKQIVCELCDLTVTKLHESTFANTEVHAYLVTGKRAVNRKRNVLLRKMSLNGNMIDEFSISSNAAIESLDIDYHRSLERLGMKITSNVVSLGSLGAVIMRGSRSHNDFDRLGLNAFHTSNFAEGAQEIILAGAIDGFNVARPGDILIPRVGSRCLGRQAKVLDGMGLFTDCVYRLSIKQSERVRVWRTLTSSFGHEWRLVNAGGSCAKHLTVQTLQMMPIFQN